MKFSSVVAVSLSLLPCLNAHASEPVSFEALMQQFQKSSMPTEAQLANNEWGFVAVVGNTSLVLEQESGSDRIDYENGLKNGDDSVMSLIFTQQDPRFFPFMSLERQCYLSADRSEYFLAVTQDAQAQNVSFSYYADMTGADTSMVLTDSCRLSVDGSDQYLICPVTMKLQNPVPPVYQAPEYQEANGKIIAVQVYKNGSWDPNPIR